MHPLLLGLAANAISTAFEKSVLQSVGYRRAHEQLVMGVRVAS